MPPKKRGMSLEDKRDTILSIFHETKDVFVLKVTRHTTCITGLLIMFEMLLLVSNGNYMERRILRNLHRSEVWFFRVLKTCFRCVALIRLSFIRFL
jgi:hypothetical protein